jgi:hypothetical protein
MLKSKAMNILREYDDFLKAVLADEEAKIGDVSGDSEFAIVSKTFLNKGIRQGLRGFLAAINKAASQ